MLIHEQIKNNIKESLKAGQKIRLEVMRGILTALTNELVSSGKKPQDFLSDEDVIKVITRLAKQRKDSIFQFEKGGREDLVKEESEQLEILNKFLPKQMEKNEIEDFIKELINKEDKIDTTKKGIFMSTAMKELKGKADGALVKEIVDKLFI